MHRPWLAPAKVPWNFLISSCVFIFLLLSFLFSSCLKSCPIFPFLFHFSVIVHVKTHRSSFLTHSSYFLDPSSSFAQTHYWQQHLSQANKGGTWKRLARKRRRRKQYTELEKQILVLKQHPCLALPSTVSSTDTGLEEPSPLLQHGFCIARRQFPESHVENVAAPQRVNFSCGGPLAQSGAPGKRW